MKKEFFTSRWAIILSTLGIAVGTGNIWRFSRIVAQNEGGTFLIPWIVFLFIWSLPLIIAEFAIGKFTRLSPLFAIPKIAGKNFLWMGGFISFVSTAIMFYYSVITGWCINYLYLTLSGNLFTHSDYTNLWNNFSHSYKPVLFQIAAMIFGAYIIYRGVVKGIESISKILVSSLVIILIFLAIKAVSLPNSISGLEYLFAPNFEKLFDYKIWLAALTQNAWDTGAGWGLILTYAVYLRKKDDIALNASILGFGNNSISLLAGIIIFSTAFSLSNGNPIESISSSGPANTGMTFIFLPQLFSKISDSIWVNSIFATGFFAALSMAAFTSLISMIELTTNGFYEMGIEKNKAILIVTILGILFGLPSALNINFLINQDWVWGVALILSGSFISISVIKFSVEKFRTELVNPNSDFKVGKIFNFLIQYLIPIQSIILLVWWLYSSVSWDSEWYNPFHAENAGTCIFQWAVILIALITLNKVFLKKVQLDYEN